MLDRHADNSKRVADRDALRAPIVEAFAPLTAAEVTTRLDAAQIASALVNHTAGLLQHEQRAARADGAV